MSDRLGEAAGNVGGSVAGAAAALGPNVDLAAAAASGSVTAAVRQGACRPDALDGDCDGPLTDAAAIFRDICLRSGAGFPDLLAVDHDAKFTSEVFRAIVNSMGWCLIVGSAHHKDTDA